MTLIRSNSCWRKTGWCQPLDDECKKLGVKANLCGKCEALPGGGNPSYLDSHECRLRSQTNTYDRSPEIKVK
jgi:hypothetical protein